ncbi:diacylglycerol/lipid kinase family protein [Ekhidna sp. To15]|uniref:diacylglycerol/lipid kinase family protein n=1 Tax=Ekhidna sp. To15 TaxID=3395267 RepID=UPI003F52050A
MEERKIFIIWNPFSGGDSEALSKKLASTLREQQIVHEVFDTIESMSATRTVMEHLDSSFTDLIIIGGDGTINESINGLKYDIPVGIVPAGTGDDFIKNVSVGKSVEDRIQTAVNGNIVRIDLGQCNDRKFVNGVGIGFDGQIVEDMTSKRVGFLTGHAAYYYHVLRILGGYKERSFKYFVDGKSMEKELILLSIGNGTTFGGGFKLMPKAKVNDGLLDVCEIGKLSPLRRFLNIGKLSNGTHGNLKEVSFHQVKEVSVDAHDMLFAHIDGEQIGKPPFQIKVLQEAMQLRVIT